MKTTIHPTPAYLALCAEYRTVRAALITTDLWKLLGLAECATRIVLAHPSPEAEAVHREAVRAFERECQRDLEADALDMRLRQLKAEIETHLAALRIATRKPLSEEAAA